MVIMTEQYVKDTLNSLVHKRCSIVGLEIELSKKLDVNIKLEDISREDDELTDYNLIGFFVCGEIFCDFDIYYLPMRRKGFDGADMCITEVGYEFQ
jgi:hypothetical protein